MESTAGGGGDASKKKSIVVVDMLEEFINRDILKQHFEQYGTVERLACSVSKKYAVIHFSTVEEADNALKNGKTIRADAPQLKIFRSAKPAPTASQAAQAHGGQSSSTTAAPPTRVVLRRKISRNFSTSPPSELPSNVASSSAVVKSSEMPASSQPGPLKSCIKVSRPSPFLRKRPSFGDKTGKSGTPTAATRSPFSLPPRNMLSLDRRKERTLSGGETAASASDEGLKSSSATKRRVTTENLEIDSSSSTVNPSDREQDIDVVQCAGTSVLGENAPIITNQHGVGSSTHSQEIENIPARPLPVDVDESTEDVADPLVGRDSLAAYTNDNEYDFGDGDAQDTAEATTEEEEEGEILEEDEPDGDEDNDEHDDVYESPMKRFESEAKKSKSKTDSGGEFSFKLSKGNNSSSSGTIFQLPFTSPFSLGDAPKLSSSSLVDAPKPFPSTSFGNSKPFGTTTVFGDAPKPLTSTSFGDLLKPPTISTSFGAAPKPFTSTSFGIKVNVPSNMKSSSSSSSTLFVSPVVEKVEIPKERQKEKSLLGSQGFLRKTETTELEKAEPSPFGIFSSVPGNLSSKPVTANVDNNKPFALFSTKPSTLSSQISSSSSSASVAKRTGIAAPPPSATFASTSQALPSSSQMQKDVPNPLLLTFNPDTPEAQKLFSERATTVEERYRLLEARDKVIRARVPKTKVNVKEATRLIGTCPDMCPEKERYMRQFQRQLVGYETLPGPDFSVDHQRAIKVYCRSSAEQEEPLPQELRPGPTLDYTMQYLLQMIVPLGDHPDENLSDWYHFLWHRTRSIRKDITQQQIIDLTAVSLYEKCARFHIHCGSRLCELDVHSFDPKLNDENLMKCLQSLEHLYEDLRRRQVTCPNEPEFRAYQIMMNLNEGDALYNAQQLPEWILSSADVKVALKLHHSIYTKNFVAFFKTVENLPYMTSCILHRYFFQVRSLGLRCIMKAHCILPKYETAMPMSTLQRMLGYGSEEAMYFNYLCEAHGIHCDMEDNKVILKRKMFYFPEFSSIYREKHLIDTKLQTSVPAAVNGGPLPNIDFSSRTAQSSFNENGQLIPGDIVSTSSSSSKVGTDTISVAISQPALEANKLATAIQPLPKSSSFSFARVFPAKKEPVVPPPPIVVVKPDKEIDAACQAVTSRLIDESINQDVVELSEARLAEAKKQQKIASRKKLQEDIATSIAQEFLEKVISQHVAYEVRSQTISQIRQFVAVEDASKTTLELLMEETVLNNTTNAARTELTIAKELHHRQLRMLEEIFARVRARFALERWLAYTKKKRQERELQQEKRREELWNFPAIDSYTHTTKDVYNAFCGRSNVQPSINKADSFVSVDEILGRSFEKSPDGLTSSTKAKRRSEEGDPFCIPAKIPKLSPEINMVSVNKLRELWEFPSVDSYSRNNRQVLEAFCGNSVANNTIPSPISSFTPLRKDFKLPNYGFKNFNNTTPGSLFFRPIGSALTDGRFSDEIKNKATQSTTDMLKSVQNFLSEVREETQKLDNLEPYQKTVDNMTKAYPQICAAPTAPATHHHVKNGDNFSLSFTEFNNAEWMEIDDSPINIAATNLDNDDLLRCIQQFTHQVREEKEKSWNVDTFLNDIQF